LGDYAFIFEGTAGLLYLLVGIRLWMLGGRKRDVAARLIGATFLLWGASYLLYNAPIAAGEDSLVVLFFFGGRIVYDIGAICIALFTQRVFRPSSRWGRSVVASTALLLAVGVIGSAALGDWKGVDALGNPWFWVEWVGMTLPFAWMAVEGWLEYQAAHRRARLGLCDALACNRFLLWGLTGACLVASNISTLDQCIDYQREGRFTLAMDALVGVAEIFTIAVIWLVFFTPRWYRRWIERTPEASREVSAV
jgi:hypothetical protein